MSVLIFRDCTKIISQSPSVGDDEEKSILLYLGLRLVADGQHLCGGLFCEIERCLSERQKDIKKRGERFGDCRGAMKRSDPQRL